MRSLLAVLVLSACPSTGPVTIPCRSNAQCPTGWGCTTEGVCEKGNAGTSGSTLQITPQTANVMVGGTVQFSALLDDAPAAADWSLTGDGSIDRDGLYTAPMTAPAMPVVTVKAVSRDVPGAAATALVSVRELLPQPMLASIAPTQANAGAPDTMLVAMGSGFLPTTELRLDGVRLDTIYTSATQLNATIPAAQLVTGRTATVLAVTPGLGGTSAGASFVVSNPQAALGAINPTTALAGAQATTLVLTGTGFVQGAIVTAAGAQLPSTMLVATVVSGTQISATLSPMVLQKSGLLTIAVRNPGPGGGGVGDQIFRVDPVIRTVGGGYTGDTGLAAAATLTRVTYMAFHPTTNELYYAEPERHRVMKIDVTGRTRKVAGGFGCTFSGDAGPAVQAGVCTPRGLAFDALGNLFIADSGNARIRKIDTTGTISTYAGTGSCSYAGEGLAAATPVADLLDLKFAPSGNLYLSTASGCGGTRVRRISPAGMSSLVAGNGTNASTADDGGVQLPAASAIQNPVSIAVDALENVYIGEHDAHRIKRVAADGGSLTNFAGTGGSGNGGENVAATAGQLSSPRALAWDADGGLVVSSFSGFRLRRIDLVSNTIATYAGSTSGLVQADGIAAAMAKIGRPSALALSPAGVLHFATYADTNAAPNSIKRVDAAGLVQPVLGPAPLATNATDAFVFRPYGVAFDPSGTWFVSDRENDRIYKVDTSGGFGVYAGTGVRGVGGDGALAKDAQLSAPEAMVFDSGDLYFLDNGNARVRKIDAGGIISTVAGGGATPAGCSSTSNTPTAPPAGAGAGYNCFGDDYFASSAILISPRGLLKAGNTLFISEYEPSLSATLLRGNRIRRVNLQTNVITTLAGSTDFRGPTNGFSGDNGPATAALLLQPTGMAIDPAGDLVFGDSGNRRLRKVNLVSSPVGQITTIAGSATSSSTGNGGPAAVATFRRPWGLVYDASGNLYVSDFDANNVRRIDAQLIVAPVAGAQGCSSCALGFAGDGAAARDSTLANPTGIAVSPSGAVFVCDSFNERVRAIGP